MSKKPLSQPRKQLSFQQVVSLRQQALLATNPAPSGKPLTDAQVEEIAKAMYRRFHYDASRPQWPDPQPAMEAVRNALRAQVRQVVDAIQMTELMIVDAD